MTNFPSKPPNLGKVLKFDFYNFPCFRARYFWHRSLRARELQLAQAKHDLAQELAHANMYLAHAKSSEWLQLSQSHPRAREAGSRASE
ncbi:hypothetical protein QL285_087254 [Trifolium repens]|nr:hypothetical protein QL285_087254 [Trifolium repens]